MPNIKCHVVLWIMTSSLTPGFIIGFNKLYEYFLLKIANCFPRFFQNLYVRIMLLATVFKVLLTVKKKLILGLFSSYFSIVSIYFSIVKHILFVILSSYIHLSKYVGTISIDIVEMDLSS